MQCNARAIYTRITRKHNLKQKRKGGDKKKTKQKSAGHNKSFQRLLGGGKKTTIPDLNKHRFKEKNKQTNK